MVRYFREEHDIFRRSVQKFLRAEAAPSYAEWERKKRVPRSFWREMGRRGLLCPWAEEDYGGTQADFAYSVVILEELEKIGSGLVGIGLHNEIAMPYIYRYGTQTQKKRWIPPAVRGELISALAMTEPEAGSDLAAIRTTAVKKGDHYVLNGQKTFITNGMSADLVIVACRTAFDVQPPYKGISLLVVEAETPGFSRGRQLQKVGQHAQDTAELIFADCSVPAHHLLGEENRGFYYLMEQLARERLVVALGAVVSAEKMLEVTIEYVKKREAFGQPLSRFQNTRFKISELATEIKIARTFVDELITRYMAGEKIDIDVSMAKWWTTDLAKKTAAECLQLHGGYGYMEEYEIARRFRDTAVTSIYAGSNEIMKEMIARSLEL